MVLELIFRFIIGGLVVCSFAVICEMVKPISLGGICGAAPSVALATLGLTFFSKGNSVASIEGRSMVAGAVALVLYSLTSQFLLPHRHANALVVTGATWLAWLAVAFGIWAVVLR
jgi:hypothetical protein